MKGRIGAATTLAALLIATEAQPADRESEAKDHLASCPANSGAKSDGTSCKASQNQFLREADRPAAAQPATAIIGDIQAAKGRNRSV